MEEDSLEEKLSFGPEYGGSIMGESPIPMTSTPLKDVFKSLVEKASEKTIIYTSQNHHHQTNHESLNDEILISSSSWINLQVISFTKLIKIISGVAIKLFCIQKLSTISYIY